VEVDVGYYSVHPNEPHVVNRLSISPKSLRTFAGLLIAIMSWYIELCDDDIRLALIISVSLSLPISLSLSLSLYTAVTCSNLCSNYATDLQVDRARLFARFHRALSTVNKWNAFRHRTKLL